jgi:hypothetical protein
MAESAFEKAFAEEMKGAERDFAAFAWEMNNLVSFADLGRHPTTEQVDAELKRLREVKRHR